MKRLFPIVLLALPLFAGPKEEVLAMHEAFETGARSGNAAQMVSIFADDATLMAPDMPSLSGREAITQYWGGMLQQLSKVEVDLMMDHLEVLGDVAIERGRYEISSPIQDSGKYVHVWRKTGGKWLLVTDIFNANQRAPQTAK